jgi:cell division protein FtsI/penicillin-binding protein 2
MVSPLALAAAYGALANDGLWVAPRIVLEPAPVRREPEPIVAPNTPASSFAGWWMP